MELSGELRWASLELREPESGEFSARSNLTLLWHLLKLFHEASLCVRAFIH